MGRLKYSSGGKVIELEHTAFGEGPVRIRQGTATEQVATCDALAARDSGFHFAQGADDPQVRALARRTIYTSTQHSAGGPYIGGMTLLDTAGNLLLNHHADNVLNGDICVHIARTRDEVFWCRLVNGPDCNEVSGIYVTDLDGNVKRILLPSSSPALLTDGDWQVRAMTDVSPVPALGVMRLMQRVQGTSTLRTYTLGAVDLQGNWLVDYTLYHDNDPNYAYMDAWTLPYNSNAFAMGSDGRMAFMGWLDGQTPPGRTDQYPVACQCVDLHGNLCWTIRGSSALAFSTVGAVRPALDGSWRCSGGTAINSQYRAEVARISADGAVEWVCVLPEGVGSAYGMAVDAEGYCGWLATEVVGSVWIGHYGVVSPDGELTTHSRVQPPNDQSAVPNTAVAMEKGGFWVSMAIGPLGGPYGTARIYRFDRDGTTGAYGWDLAGDGSNFPGWSCLAVDRPPALWGTDL